MTNDDEALVAELLDLSRCDTDALMDRASAAITRLAKENEELRGGPTMTHLWGQPVAEMRHALEFLEQHTGTAEIRASVKRLTLVLRGQRDLIAEQSAKLGKLEAENAELRQEWAGLQAIREGLHRELNRLRAENEDRAALSKALEQAKAERDEAHSTLAALADCMNVANREEGLREVKRYRDMHEMRGGIDALVLTARSQRHKAMLEAHALRAELASLKTERAKSWRWRIRPEEGKDK